TDLKKQGKKVVFTNGCFDIIHAGHVRYLKEAGDLGDTLIIGLNSDNSISKIKPGRPVIPQDQRAEVISAFSMVDYITFFEEETPYGLIKEIQPDVLVKGSDWKEEDIVGRDIAGRVHTVPYVSGLSTSEIINKIKNLK
ncbi:MAG TPA: D-glycero-beta-D-manno-heptose 1-phosphate adenylyltransferase, partial [Nitrospirae bacterium]|nr:D-glycero-beta-D-manno-heptose 1-phosphate adenylyltransferase [Nitrospirota bacterium]